MSPLWARTNTEVRKNRSRVFEVVDRGLGVQDLLVVAWVAEYAVRLGAYRRSAEAHHSMRESLRDVAPARFHDGCDDCISSQVNGPTADLPHSANERSQHGGNIVPFPQ